MKDTEFCYWLQGLFELAHLTDVDKFVCIKKHLQMIEPKSGFTAWLEGYLDGAKEPSTLSLRTKLSKHFEHVIDPTYPDQDKLNQIHNGPGHSDKVYRC